MGLIQKISYAFSGPFWPEYLIAQELRNKGWNVFRQINVYNPKERTYTEIDILAVSSDGLIFIEVKSWRGNWKSFDHHYAPHWKKIPWQRHIRSPVEQIALARRAFIHSILKTYPEFKEKILDSSQTYVFLDRGNLINALEPEIQKAWKNMQVEVLPLRQHHKLPWASRPAAESFVAWVEKYHHHYKWKWYFKIIKKLKLLNKYVQHLSTSEKPWSGR